MLTRLAVLYKVLQTRGITPVSHRHAAEKTPGHVEEALDRTENQTNSDVS